MSSSLYILKYLKTNMQLSDEPLNEDELEEKGFRVYQIHDDKEIPDYIVKNGVKHQCWRKNIDIFKTCEIISGYRPNSISWGADNSFAFTDGEGRRVRIPYEGYKKYYYDEYFDAYIYRREAICDSDCTYLIDLPEGQIDLGTIRELIEKCVESIENNDYGYQLLFALEKARIEIEKGSSIVFDID